jgi:ubiquinol-cytochrome c reductase cytochrome b subunit
MFSALLALLILPYADLSRTRGIQFKPLSKISFFIFVANFIFLMVLGAKHVESPFIELGMFCTALYFLFYLVFTPVISIIENTLFNLSSRSSNDVESANKKKIFKRTLVIPKVKAKELGAQLRRMEF